MINLFKYYVDMENYESFKGFDYIYIYIYIYRQGVRSEKLIHYACINVLLPI